MRQFKMIIGYNPAIDRQAIWAGGQHAQPAFARHTRQLKIARESGRSIVRVGRQNPIRSARDGDGARRKIDLPTPRHRFSDARRAPVIIFKLGFIPEGAAPVIDVRRPPIINAVNRVLTPVRIFAFATDCDGRRPVESGLRYMDRDRVFADVQKWSDVGRKCRYLTLSFTVRATCHAAIDVKLHHVVAQQLNPSLFRRPGEVPRPAQIEMLAAGPFAGKRKRLYLPLDHVLRCDIRIPSPKREVAHGQREG